MCIRDRLRVLHQGNTCCGKLRKEFILFLFRDKNHSLAHGDCNDQIVVYTLGQLLPQTFDQDEGRNVVRIAHKGIAAEFGGPHLKLHILYQVLHRNVKQDKRAHRLRHLSLIHI